MVGCKGQNIPLGLIDNNSTVNVCPMRKNRFLGLKDDDFQPSIQGIRAYDNCRRPVHVKVNLTIQTRPVARTKEFQIVDIKPTFNLLLGCPWLNVLAGVASTVHQMVKLSHNGVTTAIHAPPLDVSCSMTEVTGTK